MISLISLDKFIFDALYFQKVCTFCVGLVLNLCDESVIMNSIGFIRERILLLHVHVRTVIQSLNGLYCSGIYTVFGTICSENSINASCIISHSMKYFPLQLCHNNLQCT